jgi:hypothetical protein
VGDELGERREALGLDEPGDPGFAGDLKQRGLEVAGPGSALRG